MDDNRSVTKRLIDWIQEASLEKTFTSVAEEIGIDEKTVRNIFNDYVTELEDKQIFALLNGLELMRFIYLKTIVVLLQMLKINL